MNNLAQFKKQYLINLMMNNYTTKIWKAEEIIQCDLLVLAAGFEDRAFQFISNCIFNGSPKCILIKFDGHPEYNEDIFSKFLIKANEIFGENDVIILHLKEEDIRLFEMNFNRILLELPRSILNVCVDVSGMTTYLIFIILHSLRTLYPYNYQTIIYTEAKSYFPTFEEYKLFSIKSKNNEEFVPRTMTMEMSEVLILETFSGHRSKEGISCLAVFPGYDANRTGGIIDSLNPSLLLFLYGDPGIENLKWRLDLSKQLHRKFESTRKCAAEVVSTLDYFQSFNILEKYYEFLYEDYDLTIAPICSKMQVVGTFLFWERYKEVQLVFPLPVGYDLDKRPLGSGLTYLTILEARNSLYHSQNYLNLDLE